VSASTENGNGVAGALRASLVFVSLLTVVSGSIAASHYILTEQIEASRSERVVVLDGMRADIADHAYRLGLLEQHAAAMKETVREIETQFSNERSERVTGDKHLAEILELRLLVSEKSR